MSLADGCGERALQSDACALDRVDRLLRYAHFAVDALHWRDVNGIPLNGRLGGLENLLHARRDLLANTVTWDQSHSSDLRFLKKICMRILSKKYFKN